MNIREIMGMKIREMNMLACINGIICVGGFFVDGFEGFVLWNPATKEDKVVSYPTADCPAMCAFGYDHNSNDYKVSQHRYSRTTMNGVHHWVGFMDNDDINELGEDCDPEVVVCFDMSHEVFRVIRFPDDVF
ncbi:hypothetical protein SO802_025038 [Lithocarpus litseifolius]|uniref:F-box associated domain-containing protein n=1 Tax=Lithocarpus litseifolius TaxID=425828 RepID=A0AAW2BWL5_9ROSI